VRYSISKQRQPVFWLLPANLTLLGFGAVLASAAGSAIEPLVYTLF
jgi:uncharacterized protein DUF5989